MPTAEIIYEGDLRCTATHLASGVKIITDAPVDNHGKGEAFSPTDLMATSLGNCMLTIMGIAEKTHGFSIKGTRCVITKVMANDPRRVAEVHVELFFPSNNYSEKQKEVLIRIANTCPVALSLHPDLKQVIKINWIEL